MPRELDHICTPLYAAYPTRPEEEIRAQDSRVTQQQQQQASPGREADRPKSRRPESEPGEEDRWKMEKQAKAIGATISIVPALLFFSSVPQLPTGGSHDGAGDQATRARPGRRGCSLVAGLALAGLSAERRRQLSAGEEPNKARLR